MVAVSLVFFGGYRRQVACSEISILLVWPWRNVQLNDGQTMIHISGFLGAAVNSLEKPTRVQQQAMLTCVQSGRRQWLPVPSYM